MKKLYSTAFKALAFSMLVLLSNNINAQCADGSPQGTTAYDTTIYFGTGVTSKEVKFPKFDPSMAMLRCVKLIVTITGVIDTVAMQNYSAAAQTADFYYNRNDQMSGPGLTPALSNGFNGHYGAYTLTSYDGIPNVGTDFKAIPRDTVLRKVMTRTLTDSTEISQFYGSDSVTYFYNISVSTSATITGGSSSSLVLTSALVNFRFEYCTCAKVSLPVGLKNFTVTKTSAQAAELRWDSETDDNNFVYEMEMSRDGKNFKKIAVVNKKYTSNPSYAFPYSIQSDNYGRYYFRIRQKWTNGYVSFSEIRSVDFVNPFFAGTSLYPNPSSGSAGIKFVNVKAGKMLVQVSNAQGQLVSSNEIMVAATDYKLIGNLQKGMYWVKITDVATKTSSVNQLVVQ